MKAGSPFIVIFVALAAAASSSAQSLTTELDATSGYSTEGRTWVGAMQARAFGEVKSQIRFNVEGAWARRSAETSDAFSAAYAYDGRVHLNEAYAERGFQRSAFLANIRVGQYRTPFGIYSRADHGYVGFLRAPLMRSEYYWAINNTMLERGVDVTFGTPHLLAEVSVGTPGDNTDDLKRRSGIGSVVRLQGYYKSLVAGVSHINSQPYAPQSDPSPGRMDFSGIDLRWTYAGVQLRGEWLTGKQWKDGTKTWGGYVDGIVHRRFMGPVTAVFRSEQLDFRYHYSVGPYAPETYVDWRGLRHTAGARVRIPGGLTAQFNVIRHSRLVASSQPTVFDFALTYSIRASRTRHIDN